MELRELLEGDTRLAHGAMRARRPAYAREADFVERVDGTQRTEGYRLAAAFAPGREQAVAVAGFRTGHNLAWGHYLYVDDLSTVADARGQGHAGALLEWLPAQGPGAGRGPTPPGPGDPPKRIPAPPPLPPDRPGP